MPIPWIEYNWLKNEMRIRYRLVLKIIPIKITLPFSSPKNFDEYNNEIVFGITAKLSIGMTWIESIKFGK